MTPLIRFGLAWIAGIALARWLYPPWFIIILVALQRARRHPKER
jgi:hypothetical protein